jgi:hypothetical protein
MLVGTLKLINCELRDRKTIHEAPNGHWAVLGPPHVRPWARCKLLVSMTAIYRTPMANLALGILPLP